VRLLRLRFAKGPRRGEEVIFSGPRVRIGRSRDNTLVLTESDTPLSSGRHAEARLEGGAWWIVDTGSTNGTFVNVAAVVRHRLAKGDALAFGDDAFVVVAVGRASRLHAVLAILVAAAIGTAVAFSTHRPAVRYQEIAERAARSVYAVVLDEDGRRAVVGTAFAIGADGQLATNAHVADLLRRRGGALAVRGDTYEPRRVANVNTHPQWQRGSIRNDVAVLTVDGGEPLAPLPLAAGGAFAHLQRGMALASFGFPAASTDPQRPRGRLSVDVVGDVRGDYLEAGLTIAPGTSGSPVFNDAGEVVAIVAGGDFVKAASGAVVPSGSRVNWAISAERLREILRR